MRESFEQLLYKLRLKANLSNSELSELADVPSSFISGLENGNRRVGEYQARKIGNALGLEGKELEAFLLSAIDTCTDKILTEVRAYPAQLLNLPAKHLKKVNILPENIYDLKVEEAGKSMRMYLTLIDGKKAMIDTTISITP